MTSRLNRKRDAIERERLAIEREEMTMYMRAPIDAMLRGNIEFGKEIVGRAIKASGGYVKLGEELNMPPKSLIRMFGTTGNPQAKNIFAILHHLQQRVGITLSVKS